ncbi:hypothetical protein GCM10023116_01530 [Kistimonas scapharcae]|uniref:Single-stranded DNA-binding protein n=1 Tax=Kistimonas scapharcae TaxID=1036133 RepID=A0ABP8UVH5_9GAMM
MNQPVNNTWTDFNDAEVQQDFDLIPRGTIAKVNLTLKPGGYNEPHMGWHGGWATRSETGAVYLKAEFMVLSGPYAKRKVWSLIGLHSPKGPTWANMGRSFVRSLLCSARGIRQDDNAPQAVLARRLKDFGELDGMEFVARIDVEKDTDGEETNVIKHIVTPDDKRYQQVMAEAGGQSHSQQSQQYASPHTQQQEPQQGQATGQADYQFQQPDGFWDQ